jgi:hypothetical protein
MNTISEVIAPAVSKPHAGYIKDLAAILRPRLRPGRRYGDVGPRYERRLLLNTDFIGAACGGSSIAGTLRH